MRVTNKGRILGAVAALGFGLAIGQSAQASETRSFVVSWLNPAMNSVEGDCPGGQNGTLDILFRRILKDQNVPQAEIDKIMSSERWRGSYDKYAAKRGRIDGKPADVYLNPASAPDPKITLVENKFGMGFNLDGVVSPDDFTDPLTGETGVDNNVSRVMGCYERLRASPTTRPAGAELAWNGSRDGMPAWVIRLTGIDDPMNDDDVTAQIMLAKERAIRNAAGDVQTHMSYTVNPNPRMMGNIFRGKIKNGVFVSNDPLPQFYMTCDLRVQPEFDLKQARLRMELNPDGSSRGFIGGYAPWQLTYVSNMPARGTSEGQSGIDAAGYYHALKRMADTDIDATPAMRTRISATYQIWAVPAYVVDPEPTKIAADGKASGKKKRKGGLAMTASPTSRN